MNMKYHETSETKSIEIYQCAQNNKIKAIDKIRSIKMCIHAALVQ